jgi:hypothetical protein
MKTMVKRRNHEIWCCYKIFAPFVSPFVKHEIVLLSAYETQLTEKTNLSGLSVRRGTGGTRCGREADGKRAVSWHMGYLKMGY